VNQLFAREIWIDTAFAIVEVSTLPSARHGHDTSLGFGFGFGLQCHKCKESSGRQCLLLEIVFQQVTRL
jgi:hypothetical protein